MFGKEGLSTSNADRKKILDARGRRYVISPNKLSLTHLVHGVTSEDFRLNKTIALVTAQCDWGCHVIPSDPF